MKLYDSNQTQIKMKASELRIGNWVNVRQYPYENEPYQISSLSIDNTFTFKFKGDIKGCFATSIINPIPLTEEWLLKFGFKLMDTNSDGGHHFHILIVGDLRFLTPFEDCSEVSLDGLSMAVYYVHQLQNLYFALTKKELELK